MRIYRRASAALCILLHFLTVSLVGSAQIETKQSLGKKGKLFVHALHSASFFQTTEHVKWSATLKGRPSLPQWLHLLPSPRHSALAYLIGTPVTPLRQVTVHVIAKSEKSDEIKQQFIVINLGEDSRYVSATQQVLDLHVRNYDAETLVSDRSGLVGRLELAIRETFIGKNVLPYIYGIQPAVSLPQGKQFLFDKRSTGAVVQVGTQRGFYSNIYSMVRTLRSKANFCTRSDQVPINKKFQASFDIDWCSVQLHNLTLTKDFADREIDKRFRNQELSAELGPILLEKMDPDLETTPIAPAVEEQYSFWDSILVLPLFGVAIVVLLLLLVAVFFGCREGQQWRDYKTPKDQLEEYVSVRESQRHLRELSVQRQLLLMRDRESSVAPSGIHSFLQPKSRGSSVRASHQRLPMYKSGSRLNADDETVELLPTGQEMIPVGKQTVAQAAKQCGSSLHLYRNPLDSGSDMEPEENDSLEGFKPHGSNQ